MTPQTIFIVAGGSGGHIVPALQYARQWKQEHPSDTIIFFTGSRELEKKIVKNAPFLDKTIHVSMRTFSLHRWWTLPLVALNLATTWLKSLWFTLRYRPTKLITTGGLLALPFGVTAWLLHTTLDVYELNVEPGKALKALFPLATTIFCTFHETQKLCRWWKIDFSYKYQFVSYPLRFTEHDIVQNRHSTLTHINALRNGRGDLFVSDKKTMFIMGGSQGSLFLNTLPKIFFELEPHEQSKWQVIHQTGPFQEALWETWYADHAITAHVFSYNDNINDYYTMADIIICRAGAGTLFEIAFFKKPCIVIPLIALTTQHQILNAQAMAHQAPHLFTILEQASITQNPTVLTKILKDYTLDKKNNVGQKSVVSCMLIS